MKVNFELPNGQRKDLVKAIATFTGRQEVYKGAPSFAYKIGDVEVLRGGEVVIASDMPKGDVAKLMKHLKENGFTADYPEIEVETLEAEETSEQEQNVAVTEVDVQPNEAAETVQTADDQPDESMGLTVAVPNEKVDLVNLEHLFSAKGALIQKALGIKAINITYDEGKVLFPWFDWTPDSETTMAYIEFIMALCKLTKTAKRISPKAKETENEKYAFRCFLLRLGFIGDEYKAARKILLSKLEGSSAFKGGKPDEAE